MIDTNANLIMTEMFYASEFFFYVILIMGTKI